MDSDTLDLAMLTTKQACIIPLLAVGKSASEAAKIANVSASQISEWRSDPRFMRVLAKARRCAIDDAQRDLNALAQDAVQCIRDLMNHSPNPQVRLRAAALVLEQVSGFRELDHRLRDEIAPPSEVDKANAKAIQLIQDSISSGETTMQEIRERTLSAIQQLGMEQSEERIADQ